VGALEALRPGAVLPLEEVGYPGIQMRRQGQEEDVGQVMKVGSECRQGQAREMGAVGNSPLAVAMG